MLAWWASALLQEVWVQKHARLLHENIPQEVFLALSFDGQTPQGIVTFHEGFKRMPTRGDGDALQRA